MGPSTGLPTRTSQGDILMAYYLGHGDTRHVLLLPGEHGGVLRVWLARVRSGGAPADADLCAERPRSGHEPLDERSRSPIPTSHWTAARCSAPRNWPKLGGFHRYEDVDGDGVGYRTLPAPKAHWRRTSRAAAATTPRRSTPSAPTSGRRIWRGCAASSSTRARSCRSRWLTRLPARRLASSPMARTTRRLPRRGACWRTGASRRAICGCAPCPPPRSSSGSSRKYPRHLRRRKQLRRADGEDSADRGARSRRPA